MIAPFILAKKLLVLKNINFHKRNKNRWLRWKQPHISFNLDSYMLYSILHSYAQLCEVFSSSFPFTCQQSQSQLSHFLIHLIKIANSVEKFFSVASSDPSKTYSQCKETGVVTMERATKMATQSLW